MRCGAGWRPVSGSIDIVKRCVAALLESGTPGREAEAHVISGFFDLTADGGRLR
jgi:hypothetical protein